MSYQDSEDLEDCDVCAGTGLGHYGPPTKSLCSSCNGTGNARDSSYEDQLDYDREEYERWSGRE